MTIEPRRNALDELCNPTHLLTAVKSEIRTFISGCYEGRSLEEARRRIDEANGQTTVYSLFPDFEGIGANDLLNELTDYVCARFGVPPDTDLRPNESQLMTYTLANAVDAMHEYSQKTVIL